MGMSHRYPQDSTLDGPQNRSEYYEERENTATTKNQSLILRSAKRSSSHYNYTLRLPFQSQTYVKVKVHMLYLYSAEGMRVPYVT